MIDHKNKILFIHIPKNAGTSIERTVFNDYNFENKNDGDYLIGYSSEFKINLQHATINELLQFNLITEEVLEQYNSFAVVRDPFTRSISSYFWLMKDLKIEDSFKNFLLEQGQFSKENLSKNKIQVKDHMYTQSAFLKCNDEIKVKKILRFEDLPYAFNDYMDVIGNEAKLTMHYKKNKKSLFKIIKLFNEDNVKLIQERFEEDFINFDYKMDFNRLNFFINYG